MKLFRRGSVGRDSLDVTPPSLAEVLGYDALGQLGQRHLPDIEQSSQSSGSNVIPRRAISGRCLWPSWPKAS